MHSPWYERQLNARNSRNLKDKRRPINGDLRNAVKSSGNSLTSSSSSNSSLVRMPSSLTSLLRIESYSKTRPDNFLVNAAKDRKVTLSNDPVTELEELYKTLGLNDEDLLDRAERRDLPSKFQLMRYEDANDSDSNSDSKHSCKGSNSRRNGHCDREKYGQSNRFCRSCSIESMTVARDKNYVRAPPYRRSAIPDLVEDDLAHRKFNPKADTVKPICDSPSYLLFSSVYTPTIEVREVFGSLSDPNIETDDLSYRKLTQSDGANVAAPHPPFGIPNGVVTHSSPTDYLHSELDPEIRNRVWYRVKPDSPHLVRDDMAFRSLRKEFEANKN